LSSSADSQNLCPVSFFLRQRRDEPFNWDVLAWANVAFALYHMRDIVTRGECANADLLFQDWIAVNVDKSSGAASRRL
jgi:hypothetical protein